MHKFVYVTMILVQAYNNTGSPMPLMHALCPVTASHFNGKKLVSHHLEMRLSSYPACGFGLLIRGTTLRTGVPYGTNARTDYTD